MATTFESIATTMNVGFDAHTTIKTSAECQRWIQSRPTQRRRWRMRGLLFIFCCVAVATMANTGTVLPTLGILGSNHPPTSTTTLPWRTFQ